jgi:dephospho-CoA kinase
LSFVLGLTGKYCAGKNLAASFLEAEGFRVLDADRMGHAVLEEARILIEERFGPGLLRADGSLDRKELGRRVFSRPSDLAALEAIVHPGVIAKIEGEIDSGGERGICVNAALLYRTVLAARCDLIIEIRAPLILRMRRALSRDGTGLGAFLARAMRQRKIMPVKSLHKNKIIIIRNSRGPEDLRKDLKSAIFDKFQA